MQRGGVPVEDGVSGGTQLGDGVVEHAGDGRMGADDAVVAQEAEDEGADQDVVVHGGAPGQRGTAGILLPRALGDDGLHGQADAVEAAGQRADGRGHVFLAVGRDGNAAVGQTGTLLGGVRRRGGTLVWQLLIRTLGFNPYRPNMWEGMRMLPPMSVPQPSRLPCEASRADSPPVEPPGV